MCGIAGRFDATGLVPDPRWSEESTRLLAHRGPEGSGHYQDGYVEFVHRRLALVDLSPTGHQPLSNEDGTVWVCYNGEIYNHRELRAELLSRGHRFRGTSDTEVLVHLYEEHGAAMVERLRGMFAFAIYDQRARRLLLARDRFGIKPLYVARHAGQLVFASEIKAILPLAGFRPTVDRQAVYDFLALSYVPEPATAFAEIRALPHGTVLEVDAAGERPRRFHELRAKPDRGLAADAVAERAGELLERAVEAQRVADVPVAALLSGGIDSSLVVAAHARSGSTPPTTFNVRFPDGTYDETSMARAVSARYGTDHHSIELGERDTHPEALFDLLRHFDQPFADTSLIPMFWVSRSIRDQGIICTLSGDGGDEAFGGYAQFWRANRLLKVMALPSLVQSASASAGKALAGWTLDYGRQLAKAVDLARVAGRDGSQFISGFASYLTEEQKQALVPESARAGLAPVHRLFAAPRAFGPRDIEAVSGAMTESLFSVGLVSDMLRKVDMMSMRASIEIRVPMLDEELVELGLGIPHALKTDGKVGKQVLRTLAHEWLPREVADHPKQGFSIPIDVMIGPTFHEALADLLLADDARTRPVLSRPLVAEWLRLFRASGEGKQGGQISRGGVYQRIFMLLSLELWLRDHELSW